jgi:hypothetical protein
MEPLALGDPGRVLPEYDSPLIQKVLITTASYLKSKWKPKLGLFTQIARNLAGIQISKNLYGLTVVGGVLIFLYLFQLKGTRKIFSSNLTWKNAEQNTLIGRFGSTEMPLSKKIYKDTLRALSNYSDSPIRVFRNRHYVFRGSRNGMPWLFTLPCSPSGQYVEHSVRSMIRRFHRQLNWMPRQSGTASKPYLPPYKDRCTR